MALPAIFCALGLPQLIRNGFGIALGAAFAALAVAALWPMVRGAAFRPSRVLFYGGLLFIGTPALRPLAGETFADWLFAASVLALIVEVLAGRPPGLRLPPPLLIAGIAVFLFASLVSAAASNTPASAFGAGVRFVLVTGAWIWLGTLVLERFEEVSTAVLAWSISAAAASVAGFVQLAFGDVIPGTSPTWHRMTGLGQQVNEFGVITATAVVAVAGLFALTSGRDRRLVGATGLLLIGGLLLSGSLSAMAGLVGGALVAAALAGRLALRVFMRRNVLIGISAAAVAVVVAVSVGVSRGLIPAPWTRLTQATSRVGGTGLAEQQATLWRRVDTLRTGWDTIKAHPLLGAGQNPDGVGLAHGTYVHDTLLGAWAGLGFIAMIGVILCLVAPFTAAARLLKLRPEIRPLAIGLTGATAVFTVYALANPTLYRRYGWVPALLVIALAQPSLARRPVLATGGVDSTGPPVGFRAMTRVTLVVAAVAVVLGLAAGYVAGKKGSSSTTTTVTTTNASRAVAPVKLQVLTQREVDKYPASSPQHALLAWWRTVQFANYAAYASDFTSQLQRKIAADPKSKQALAALSGFANYARVKFVSLKTSPLGAQVYAEVDYRAKAPNGKVFAQTYPRVFTFVRQDGTWRLANDNFVQQILPPSLRRT